MKATYPNYLFVAFVALIVIGCCNLPVLTIDRGRGFPPIDVLAIADLSPDTVAVGGRGGMVLSHNGHCNVFTGPNQVASMKPLAAANSVLPSNIVQCLLYTRHGKLWIGTSAGLVVYDNSTFKDITDRLPSTWSKASFDEIPVDKNVSILRGPALYHDITSLYECKNGRLIIGSRNAGLFISDHDYSINLVNHGTDANEWVTSIAETSAGDLWIGVYGIGVVRGSWTGETFAVSKLDIAIPKEVRSLCIDQYDNVWIGTHDGVFKLSTDGMLYQWNIQNGLPDDNVWQVYQDRGGIIWIITSSGLSAFKGNCWHSVAIGNQNPGPFAVLHQSDRGYWICTNSGVQLYRALPIAGNH